MRMLLEFSVSCHEGRCSRDEPQARGEESERMEME